MSDSFYLFLLSNVNTFNNSNTSCRFKSLLPKNIILQGEWEVALSEIQYQSNWLSVPNELYVKFTCTNGKFFDYSVAEGMYSSPYEIWDKMNKSFKKHYDQQINCESLNLLYDEKRNIAKINKTKILTIDSNAYDKIDKSTYDVEKECKWKVNMSQDFKNLFGFESDLEYDDFDIIGNKSAKFITDYDCFFIYSNIIQPSIIGDKYANILRIVNVPNTFKHNENISAYFKLPFYVPLQNNKFREVEIDIRDTYGSPILFESGAITRITLHFRKKKEMNK